MYDKKSVHEIDRSSMDYLTTSQSDNVHPSINSFPKNAIFADQVGYFHCLEFST